MEALRELQSRTALLESRTKSLQLKGLELDEELRQLRSVNMNYSNLDYRKSLPSPSERIWKDECSISFATPFSPGGLFLNLKTLTAFSADHVRDDWERTGKKCVYLRQQWIWVPEATNDDGNNQSVHQEIKKLAIGLEGGFQLETDKGYVKKNFSISTGPKFFDDYAIESAPDDLRKLIDYVIAKDDASRQMDVMAWEAANELMISRYAQELEQVENGVKLSPDPTTWVCEDSEMKENLWLNLSTGYIGSGRPNWDGTGGTGAALKHYQQTGGKYPLVVKLGTITPDGKADVYSYAPDEDCMVVDPYLPKHLAHFGINVGQMRKTEKTIAEMEVDLNVKYDWSRISEEGKTLEKVSGPLCVGLINLGNSCYCNSIYQSFLATRAFRESIERSGMEHGFTEKPQFDLISQFYKLEKAFVDPIHNVRPLSHKPFQGADFISPKMLKTLLGENHREFSTGEQQDVADYARHVLDRLHRSLVQYLPQSPDPSQLFNFELEERTECLQSHQVKYKRALNNILQLNVPAKPKMQNGAEEEREVIPFESCLRATLNLPDIVDDFLSPATGRKGQVSRVTRVATYPSLLMIQIKRFVLAPSGWEAIKLECSIPAPLEIDLGGEFRGKGKQPEETELPDGPAEPAFVPNAEVVSGVMMMGFSREGAIRAAKATNNNLEAAVNWAMDHSGDDDFNAPLPAMTLTNSTAPVKVSEFVPSESQIGQVSEMGFTRNGAIRALKASNGNTEEAIMWALEHSQDADFNDAIASNNDSISTPAAEPFTSDSVDEESLAILMSTGIEPEPAKYVLKKCENNAERAMDYFFSRGAEGVIAEMKGGNSPVPSLDSQVSTQGKVISTATTTTFQDSNVSTKYHLKGVISHVGKSTMSGHYVAHINQSNAGEKPKWVFFNDEKVVLAQDPPLDLGYILMYERID